MAYTKSEFAALPLTLSLKEFVAWSGLRPDVVREMVQSGAIGCVPVGHSKSTKRRQKCRLRKSDLARIAGFEL